MNAEAPVGNVGRVKPPHLFGLVLAFACTSIAAATACGGKVTFVTGSDGSGGGGAGATGNTNGTGTGSGLPACLADTSPGPQTIKGSKCFGWDPDKLCPETVIAGEHIPVDSCYLLESVDQLCKAADAGECCYNITETAYCK